MCSISPFRLNLNLSNTSKVNGNLVGGYKIQYSSIRGLSFACYSCSSTMPCGIGRNLIAEAVSNEFAGNYCYAIIARAIGLLDTIQYAIFAPISIVLNIICFPIFLIVGILTGLFYLCANEWLKTVCKFCWMAVITLPLTILLNIVGFVMVPLQIIVPELVVLTGFYLWDTAGKVNDQVI